MFQSQIAAQSLPATEEVKALYRSLGSFWLAEHSIVGKILTGLDINTSQMTVDLASNTESHYSHFGQLDFMAATLDTKFLSPSVCVQFWGK